MHITVIGAGKSGLAAALLAKRLGHTVFLTESKPADAYQETISKLESSGIDFEFGGNSSKALDNSELVISSPGVPPGSRIIQEAEARGIKIISELEYAYQHLKNPIIAVTGTNGKTTTTTLIAYILNNSGKKAISCGNIGTPLSELVGNIENDVILVAEVSSFQLDRIETFRPDVALILNITPDHLYYHGNMDSYIAAKWKICANQEGKNLLILNRDDEILYQLGKNSRHNIAWFSMSSVARGIYGEDGLMKFQDLSQHKLEDIMPFEDIRLPGIHNHYNSMAATLAARAFEIRNEDIRDCLMAFAGVEHRLEFVRTICGVDFVNDSKATNINATWFALVSYKKPIIWIAGGRGDSNDYSLLDEPVRKNVKAIISIGEESDAIFNHFSSSVRCIKAESLDDAVAKSNNEAESGDVVIFTPACKSFDMFMNYEHRGEVFKEIVNSI
jgi:UDP-N-acetylmuramoylalanine--D-glutamate ligase